MQGARMGRLARIRLCSAPGGMALLLAASTATAGNIGYKYDELGRLIEVTYPNAEIITYQYDPAGNRTVLTSNAVNQPPAAVADSIITPQNTAKTFDPRTNDTDPENDPLVITGKTNGVKGVVTLVGNTSLTYTPNSGAAGTDSFTYTISDGTYSSTGSVSVTINRSPTAVADSITTASNVAKTFDPRTNDTDADGDALTITAKTNGANGTVAIGGGGTSLTYTPTTNFSGSDTFTYTVSDGQGGSATANVAVTVTANTNPVANNDAFSVYYTSTRTFDPRTNDTDAENNPLTITSATSAGGATVTVASGGSSFNYTPSITSGSDTVTYQISDGQGGTATGQVVVTVRNTNTAPTAVADTITRQMGQPVTWDPRVNDSDPDGDPLTITVANTLASGVGTVTINNGTSITFTPVSGSTQAGHIVIYTISDGAGGTAQSYTGIQAQ